MSDILNLMDNPEGMQENERAIKAKILEREKILNWMKAAKKRMNDFFEKKGIEAQDIGKAIAVHEAMGLAMLAVTWSSCYLFPPSQSKLLNRPIATIKTMLPDTLSSICNNPVFQSKYGSSYIEASCCRKIIRPLTIPGKLWVTYYIVKKIQFVN